MPFIALSAVVVIAVVGLWVPFRSGRSPVHPFDLFAALGIMGSLGAGSVGAQGIALWLSGGLGLAFGLLSYLLANRAVGHFGPLRRSASAFAVIALSFFGCCSATLLAFWLGSWLVRS